VQAAHQARRPPPALYRFSTEDYRELAAVFTGPHPETGEELEVFDGPPEGVAPNDLPSQPAVFAPDYDPDDFAKLVAKLRSEAGLPKNPTGEVANAKPKPRARTRATAAKR
jgi:Mn-containing catalase